jgi:hypothetical protein
VNAEPDALKVQHLNVKHISLHKIALLGSTSSGAGHGIRVEHCAAGSSGVLLLGSLYH